MRIDNIIAFDLACIAAVFMQVVGFLFLGVITLATLASAEIKRRKADD